MTAPKIPYFLAILSISAIGTVLPTASAQSTAAENRPLGIGSGASKSLEGELVIRQRLERFFESVSKKEVKKAYNELLSSSKIGENVDNVNGLVDRTQKVLDVYGTMAEFELIRTERIGKRLARFVYFSYGAAFPLQWEFYCYRAPDEKWQLLDITVNNDLDMMFDGKSASEARRNE